MVVSSACGHPVDSSHENMYKLIWALVSLQGITGLVYIYQMLKRMTCKQNYINGPVSFSVLLHLLQK